MRQELERRNPGALASVLHHLKAQGATVEELQQGVLGLLGLGGDAEAWRALVLLGCKKKALGGTERANWPALPC